MEQIPPSERAAGVEKFSPSLDDSQVERALGVQWSPTSDTLQYAPPQEERPLTRRGMLATVASIYDPLGLIAPVLLQGKQILQSMCTKGSGWDDPPPEGLRPRWETWKADLSSLKELQIARCYLPPDLYPPVRTELHHFSDASTKGYGMCSYLRFETANGSVHCSLVVGKSRVTPIKVVTVPRLELSAVHWLQLKWLP